MKKKYFPTVCNETTKYGKEKFTMGFPADSMKNLDDQLDEIWAKMDKLQKKQASLYIASGGVTYASVQRLILGSNSSIEASITKGNPFTVSFTGFAPKSSLLICIPLVRA